ncbi:hypothetical protein [Xanthomonas phage L522]|nr:hypothetical protein [Xanthomonas phage L522]
MSNQVFANSTHKVTFNKEGNSYEVSPISDPEAVLGSIDLNSARAFERAVAHAMKLEYALAEKNAR